MLMFSCHTSPNFTLLVSFATFEACFCSYQNLCKVAQDLLCNQ